MILLYPSCLLYLSFFLSNTFFLYTLLFILNNDLFILTYVYKAMDDMHKTATNM